MWRCESCHSTAVEGLGWIELNSQIRIDDVEDMEEYWCNSCNALSKVYFKTEPDENDMLDEEDDDAHDDYDPDELFETLSEHKPSPNS